MKIRRGRNGKRGFEGEGLAYLLAALILLGAIALFGHVAAIGLTWTRCVFSNG